MRSDARAIQELSPPPHALALDPREVARLAHCGPGPKWEEEIGAGIAEGRALIAPRALWSALDPASMAGLFIGGTPVEAIARRGTCWAFAATIGDEIEARVKGHFGKGRYLQAVILDAAGSVAVEAVCDLVERNCAGEGPSARFSPGYCMWRLENQTALFALLHPEQIGVRLMSSMIMQPIKSVTGLVVRAGAEKDLIVPAEDCAQCEATGCARRGAIG